MFDFSETSCQIKIVSKEIRQDRIALLHVFNSSIDHIQTVSFRSDLHRMDYLTMCIKEGLRLHCPVPIIGRETTKEFTLGDRVFPKGTQLTVLHSSLISFQYFLADTINFCFTSYAYAYLIVEMSE